MKQILVCLFIFILSTPGHTQNIADTMETALPSIAYIKVLKLPSAAEIESNPELNNPSFRNTRPSFAGTGFVIDKNNIVTNYHVISYAVYKPDAEIRISFQNSTKWHNAKIIGYDKIADVALLKIDGEYPSLTIASGTNLRMGDPVFTISHFYGIGWSATQGIVSSPFRFDARYPYIRELQLQILQGTGSSGGPVFDQFGHVIALNRSITSMLPDITSMPFIAINRLASTIASVVRGDTLIDSIKKIREQGAVIRADLGAHLIDFGSNSEYHLNYNDPGHPIGVAVLFLDQDNDNSTLNAFDTITQVNGRSFTKAATLLTWVENNFEVGETVNVQVYRGGSLLNIEVILRSVGA